MNNKGVSLIEVIVSITILTIVLVPVLQVLSTSVYFNIKSRTKQNQTMTAQTLMEDFKGYGVESLAEMFPGRGQTLTEAQRVTYRNQISDKLGVTLQDDSVQEVFQNTVDGSYEFALTHIQMENQKVFDARLEITPMISENQMFSVTDFSATREAIYLEELALNGTLQDVIKDDFLNNSVNGQNFLTEYNSLNQDHTKKMNAVVDIDTSKLQLKEKKMTYTISKNADQYQVMAHLELTYKIEAYPYFILVDDDAEDRVLESEEGADASHAVKYQEEFLTFPTGSDVWTVVYDLNSESESTDQLLYQNDIRAGFERLWICYFPNYSSDVKDTIKICNTVDDLSVDCCLLKQKNQELSVGSLQMYETRYNPSVSGTGKIKLYHNLTTNLGNDSHLAMPTGVSEGSFTAVKSFLEAEKLHVNRVLLYQCKLKLYEAGTGNEVEVFESTMKW